MTTTLYVLNTAWDNVSGIFTSVEKAAQYLVRHPGWTYGGSLEDCGVFLSGFYPDVGGDDDNALDVDLGDELQAAYDRLSPRS